MYPDSPFAIPVGSFRVPVKPPGVDPDQNLIGIAVSKDWLPYIIGALKQLLLETTWITSSPEELNTVQGQAFNLIYMIGQGELNSPPGELPHVGDCGCEQMCCLRWNNGVLQTLVCGVWTDVPGGPPGGVQNPTQPGSDQGGRPPAGTSQETCYHLDANGVLLLPFQVYPGDTLEITSAEGAGSDTSGIGNWFCPDGTPFVFGSCTGFGGPLGGDPASGVDHMRLIYQIGASYFDAMGGSVVVGGSGPQAVGIQVNDATISDNPGSYKVCVKLTNGETATWSHTFDFTVTSGSFVPESGGSIIGTPGHWTAGIGWESDQFQSPSSNYYEGVYIHRNIASTPIASMSLTYSITSHSSAYSPSSDAIQVSTNAVSYAVVTFGALVDGADQVLGGSQSTPPAATDIILFGASSYDNSPTYSGTATLTAVTITGLGTDPF